LDNVLAGTVVVDARDSIINRLWDGNYTRVGSLYTVASMSYNGAILPGQSRSFGFCASRTGTRFPPVVVSAAADGGGRLGWAYSTTTRTTTTTTTPSDA